MKKILLLLPVILLMTVIAGAQDDGAARWELVKTANTAGARSECGLAAANGKLYFVGGDGPLRPVEIFDPATSAWSKGAVAPAVMHHFQPVTLGDKIYVLEAFSDSNYPNQIPAANVYSYDTKADSWQKLAGLPENRRRAGAGAAVYGDKLYLVGGIQHGHSSGTTGMFDVYNPATNTWATLPDAPHIRDHSMAVVVKDKLYAIGGRNTSLHDADNFMSFFDKVVLDVDVYDFKTGKWRTFEAKLPQGTGGGTAVVLGTRIFYIGGERATKTKPNAPQKDVYYIDPESGSMWLKTKDLNKARNGVGGAVIDSKIYIAGGTNGDAGLESFVMK